MNIAEAFKLGAREHSLGNHIKAEEIWRAILKAMPDRVDVYNNLGVSLQNQGRLEESIACLRRAIELNPDFVEALNNLGGALRAQGRLDEASAIYDQAIARNPAYAASYHDLAQSRKYTSMDHPDIIRIRERLMRSDLAADDAAYLHFALGKAYDDCGEYDRAFEHYRKGNRLKRRSLNYDIKSYVQLVERIIRIMDKDFFAQRRDFGLVDQTPVFIVGMPRSGTTLAEQIIASHPAVFGAGELPEIQYLINTMSARTGIQEPYPECVEHFSRDTVRPFAEAYLRRLRQLAGPEKHIVTNKMPFNFNHLGLIALMFPRARVIHCRRHPLATCLSNYFQLFTERNDHAYDLNDLGIYYREYQRLMEHWRSCLPLDMLDIHYEELVADTEGKSREMLDFLGLEWDDRCLAFHSTDRAVTTASAWQVRQPVYKGSVERWRCYDAFLDPLKVAIDQGGSAAKHNTTV